MLRDRREIPTDSLAHPHERLGKEIVPTCRHDDGVELGVQRGELVDAGGPCPALPDDLVETEQVLFCSSCSGPPDRLRLENGTKLEELFHLGDRSLPNESSLPRAYLDPSPSAELAQRLAHRDPADPEVLRKVVTLKMLSRLKLLTDDRCFDGLIETLAQWREAIECRHL